MTQEAYRNRVKAAAPKSPMGKNIVMAFLFGGGICTVGQAFLNWYLSMGLPQKSASSYTSMTMVFLGALLTALHVYDRLAKHAGAGTLVPITGFANAVASPAMEFRAEGVVLGMSAKMFIIAGPVIVCGTLASIFCGLCYFVVR